MELNIYHGIICIIPTSAQIEQAKKGELQLSLIKAFDTIEKDIDKDGIEVESIKVKLKYNANGDYLHTPVLIAYGKNARTLAELGNNSPISVAVELENNQLVIKVIQDLTRGLSE